MKVLHDGYRKLAVGDSEQLGVQLLDGESLLATLLVIPCSSPFSNPWRGLCNNPYGNHHRHP